jgi:hypothetical protein
MDGVKIKIVNRSTMVPIPDITTRLNPHIDQMNSESWELMSATVETVGIQELIILFWRKYISTGN